MNGEVWKDNNKNSSIRKFDVTLMWILSHFIYIYINVNNSYAYLSKRPKADDEISL
jgi:hypothetical protein